MKTLIRKSIVFMLVSFFVINLSAQDRPKRERISLEDRVSRQTEMMTKQLELTADQQTKIKEINLKYAQQMETGRKQIQEKEAKDRQDMRAKMESQMVAKDADFKQVLTPEQYKKWQDKQTEMKGKMKNKMKHRDGVKNKGKNRTGKVK